jgi:hypothetical protein
MKQAARVILLLGSLSVLVTACGGGGGGSSGSTSSTTTTHNFAAGGSNVVVISVNPGPASTTACNGSCQTFNTPLVSVTVCAPAGSCGTIANVLVDTGSSGLRLMHSVLAAAGVSLPPLQDAENANNTLAECLPFADGYAWGSVSVATVTVANETTTQAIPVQVIDDDNSGPAVPSDCESQNDNFSLDSVNVLGANGVLGVGQANQDCGSTCVGTANLNDGIYWSCNAAGGNGCQLASDVTLSAQVANPVASLPTDNNGVILQLASIPATGASTASGYLVFGIGTESNNGLGSATVLAANDEGNFTTIYNGGSPSTLSSSFIDSGSNALFFNDSTLQNSLCGSSSPANEFYCPSSSVNLSATNQDSNGTSSTVSFQIANLNNLNNSYFALNDVGGPAAAVPGLGAYFDWGLPFFYGRTVFTGIEGTSSSYPNGYYAY